MKRSYSYLANVHFGVVRVILSQLHKCLLPEDLALAQNRTNRGSKPLSFDLKATQFLVCLYPQTMTPLCSFGFPRKHFVHTSWTMSLKLHNMIEVLYDIDEEILLFNINIITLVNCDLSNMVCDKTK